MLLPLPLPSSQHNVFNSQTKLLDYFSIILLLVLLLLSKYEQRPAMKPMNLVMVNYQTIFCWTNSNDALDFHFPYQREWQERYNYMRSCLTFCRCLLVFDGNRHVFKWLGQFAGWIERTSMIGLPHIEHEWLSVNWEKSRKPLLQNYSFDLPSHLAILTEHFRRKRISRKKENSFKKFAENAATLTTGSH